MNYLTLGHFLKEKTYCIQIYAANTTLKKKKKKKKIDMSFLYLWVKWYILMFNICDRPQTEWLIVIEIN